MEQDLKIKSYVQVVRNIVNVQMWLKLWEIYYNSWVIGPMVLNNFIKDLMENQWKDLYIQDQFIIKD